MMRGSRGYIRGGRGGSSFRGQSTSTYRGNSGGGHSSYNSNYGANNRDHSSGGDGGGIGGMLNNSRGRGGFDHSFNANHSQSSSSRYTGGPSANRYQVINQPQDGGGYNKRPYPGNNAHNSSSRDRSPDRKRNRPETSRRNDDYGNSSYISGGGGGGGGNSYNNRYDGNNGGGGGSGGFQPNRRYEPVNSRGGSSSQARSNAYQRSNNNNNNSFADEANAPRSVRNDRYEAHPSAQQQQHHQPPHHHQHQQPNHHSGGSGGGQFSPPVRRPYLGRGAPSNRIISTTTYRGGRGSATTYGRGTSIRRPYGSTMQVRSSATGYSLSTQRTHHATGIAAYSGGGGGGGSSYVRRTMTTATSDPIRRKVLVPRVSTTSELARKLKIAKLRSMIRKNNEKKAGKVADDLADSNPPKTKNDGQADADNDDEEEETAELPTDMDQDEADDAAAESADVDKDEADKKPAVTKVRKTDAVKLVKTVKKATKPLVVAADGERDEDELQLDNDEDEDDIVGDDRDDDDRQDDGDDQPEYAVQKRTYIKLDCVHCRRSYFTIKSYNFHLNGSQHQSALYQTAQRQRTQMNRIRMLQRRAQRNLEFEHEAEMDAHGDVGALGAPQFCQLCRLNYRTDNYEHQQSKEHRQIKRLMKPSCRTCKVGFECPMDYEVHRSSLVHLKADAEANSDELQDSVDVNWGEFQTVDSIGDVDDAELLLLKDAADADEAADNKQRKDSDATNDGDSPTKRKPRNGNADASADKEEPPVNIGVEMIREMTVMYCDVCRTTLTQRTDPEVTLRNHCRWRTHIKLYNEHMETRARSEARKLKKQQLLENIAAAEKQRRKLEPSDGGGAKTKNGTISADEASVGVTAKSAKTDLAGESKPETSDVNQTTTDTTANNDQDAAVESSMETSETEIAAADVIDCDGDEEEADSSELVIIQDKALDDLLQAVNSENPNDDEDEDSTTTTERYDRFKNSEHDGSSVADQSKVTSIKIAATAATSESAANSKT